MLNALAFYMLFLSAQLGAICIHILLLTLYVTGHKMRPPQIQAANPCKSFLAFSASSAFFSFFQRFKSPRTNHRPKSRTTICEIRCSSAFICGSNASRFKLLLLLLILLLPLSFKLLACFRIHTRLINSSQNSSLPAPSGFPRARNKPVRRNEKSRIRSPNPRQSRNRSG